MGDNTLDFFRTLLDGVPEDLWTYFWTDIDKASQWMPLEQGPAQIAAQHARHVEQNPDKQVYISVSAVDEKQGRFKRITADNSAGIYGLWADIDIADPDAHKNWNYPPTTEAALDLVKECGLEPTIVVHSGHGLQVWWLFAEFWRFETEGDRIEAANLARAWNQTLKVRAAMHNWKVDSTYDLSRVMRAPGSMNRKVDGAEVEATLISIKDACRYSTSDFEDFLMDESVLVEAGVTPTREYVVGNLKLHPNAQVPVDLFEQLQDFEPKFVQSWNRKRRDFMDQTGSTYDLSLASIAALAGWDDQQIADLIIASRRKHKDDLDKALRKDYIPRTIARARSTINQEVSAQEMDETADALKQAKRTGDSDEVKHKRGDMLDSISNQTQLEWVNFWKLMSNPPAWQGELAGGQIVNFGSSKDLFSWSKARAAIGDATDHMIERMKAPVWDRLCQAVMAVAIPVDTGLESTETGQMYLWLSEYLMTHQPIKDPNEAALTEYPYINSDGMLVLFATGFRNWLWLNRSTKIENREVSRRLLNYGATNEKVNVTISGKRTTKSVWKMLMPREHDG